MFQVLCNNSYHGNPSVSSNMCFYNDMLYVHVHLPILCVLLN